MQKAQITPSSRRHFAFSVLFLLICLLEFTVSSSLTQSPKTESFLWEEKGDEEDLNRTELESFYVRKVFWDMVRPSVNATNPNEAQSFITSIKLTKDSGPINMVLDFSQKSSYVGLKKLGRNNMSDIGIPSCGDKNGCTVLSETLVEADYGGFSYNSVEGEVKIALDDLQSLATNNDYAMKINLMLNKQADAPYKSSYGVLGIAPNSDFLDYVSKAFLWENDTIIMKFWANGLLNGYTANWWDPKYYDGSQLLFNLPAKDSRVAKNLSEWMPMEPITPTAKNWVIPSTTLKIMRDKETPLVIFENQRACFYPNLPLTFYFKEPDSSPGPYTTLLHAVNQHLCGQNTNCDRETHWIHRGYKLSLKLSGKTFKLQPVNYMWKDATVIRPGFAAMNSLFEVGGPCEGFNFAIGARFASQFSFNFKIGVKTKEVSFALSQQGGPDNLPPIRSIWLYIWLGGIAIFLYSSIYWLIFRASKEEEEDQNKDPQDSLLTQNLDEVAPVGFCNARRSEVDRVMDSDYEEDSDDYD